MMSTKSAVAVLVNTIVEMAEQQTNPVLEVIGEAVVQFREQQKYPQPPLDFQQGPWRAFYHCHAVPDSDLQEHGHFHIFTRYHDEWVHVVALSMDADGQPQAWVTVNRWVTDGPWLSATQLKEHLASARYPQQGLSLLESWLLAMLQVFTVEVSDLLETRDQVLQSRITDIAKQPPQDDRNIYTLAIQKIDLLTKLKKSQLS